MDLVFNEVSFHPLANNEYILSEKFIEMLKLYDKTRKEHGYKHLIFPVNIGDIRVSQNMTFTQWVYSIKNQSYKNKILSVPFIRPFADKVLAERLEDLNRFYYVNETAGIQEEYCTGLATAYIKDKIALSLATAECWNTPKVRFKEIINEQLDTVDVEVCNITSEDHILDETVSNKLMYSGEMKLDVCEVPFDDKPLTLSGDHHGNNKLEAFGKKILKNKYVCAVINNIDFTPQAIRFIKEINSDGTIAIVLYWENAGYGMMIQTTGRNYRETAEIAKILQNEFDR
ncbi:MAG TPA: hypothetical protein VHB48_09920 [Chitinophagaceae bacterium]|nr:hypothetical protein [Chitinophagaceae bacterium]